MTDGFAGLLVTTGGTGFGPRDLTPEGTRAVIEREAPGLAEAIRRVSDDGDRGFGMLSRAVCGTRGQALICNTPGSSGGAVEALDVILPVVAARPRPARRRPPPLTTRRTAEVRLRIQNRNVFHFWSGGDNLAPGSQVSQDPSGGAGSTQLNTSSGCGWKSRPAVTPRGEPANLRPPAGGRPSETLGPTVTVRMGEDDDESGVPRPGAWSSFAAPPWSEVRHGCRDRTRS